MSYVTPFHRYIPSWTALPTIPSTIFVKKPAVNIREISLSKELLPAHAKANLFSLLVEARFKSIQFGSFKEVPGIADTEKLYKSLKVYSDIKYDAVIRNIQEFNAAAKVYESKKKLTLSIFTENEYMDQFDPVISAALQKNIDIDGYLSCTPPERVATTTLKMLSRGIKTVILRNLPTYGDTKQITDIIDTIREKCPSFNLKWESVQNQLSFNLHGFDLKHFDEVLNLGIRSFETSMPESLNTLHLVRQLHRLGLHTGIDDNCLERIERIFWAYKEEYNLI